MEIEVSKAYFAMHPDGITSMDENKLRIVAGASDAIQPFFANAILQIFEKMQRGELKGKSPADVKVTVG